MRLLLVIAVLALTGCSLFRKGDALPPLPVQPPGPTKPDVVATLGKDLDKTDHRVASALVAIERNADKPKVVVAESRLAQSYLPAPPESDVAFAMARATKWCRTVRVCRARRVGGPPAWPPMRCGAVRIAATAKRWFWPRPAAPTHRGVTTATLEPKPTWRAGCEPSAGQCPGRAA